MITPSPPTPTGSRSAVLRDLHRRLANAEQIARDAEAAGDEQKFRRAVERLHLRTLQIDWLERRPENARCWKCGELGGEMFALAVDCLVHRSVFLMERAAAMAVEDAAGM